MVWFLWTLRAQAPSGLSVAAERNSKACRKLLRSFTKIHNSLRSDNGFLLITQFPAGQEFLLCFHRKSGGCMHAGLILEKRFLKVVVIGGMRNRQKFLGFCLFA